MAERGVVSVPMLATTPRSPMCHLNRSISSRCLSDGLAPGSRCQRRSRIALLETRGGTLYSSHHHRGCLPRVHPFPSRYFAGRMSPKRSSRLDYTRNLPDPRRKRGRRYRHPSFSDPVSRKVSVSQERSVSARSRRTHLTRVSCESSLRRSTDRRALLRRSPSQLGHPALRHSRPALPAYRSKCSEIGSSLPSRRCTQDRRDGSRAGC